jgi:hypothetical protein
MKLSEYFEKTTGRGVLATADGEGKVGIAVYGRPHFIDEENVTFVMADRLSHKNLGANPQASYLFMESGDRYVGKRLYLKKTKEESNAGLIASLMKKDPCPAYEACDPENKFLIHFHIERVLPLIGDKDR